MKKLGEYIYSRGGKDQMYINNKKIDFDAFCKDVKPETRLYKNIERILNEAFGQKIELKEKERYTNNLICFEIIGGAK